MANQFLTLAEKALQDSKNPLTYMEVWDVAVSKGFDKQLKTNGKTPWQTLGAQLFVDVRDNAESQFIKCSDRPATFFLKSRKSEVTTATIEKHEKEVLTKKPKFEFHERETHPLLAAFVYTNLQFNRGKKVHTKTIFHEKSKKTGYNEWSYPDMVGFYLPIDDWKPAIAGFNRISESNSIKLFSFELKKEINRSNYREAFFQAVSNSSWAHEGYLVTTEIYEDEDLDAELHRLSQSFGIGIIYLNLNDFDSSLVKYPAQTKANLDWETMNKICEMNPNFNKFLEDVKIDSDSGRIHKSEYDEVIQETEVYIKKIRKTV